jgi:dUTP pyrophosphatase
MPTIKFFTLAPDVVLPSLATESAACFDLAAWLVEDSEVLVYLHDKVAPTTQLVKGSEVVIQPFARALIPTGLVADIPEGYSLRAHPRSGLALKNGIGLANSEGVIDEDYVEPLFVILVNLSGMPVSIKNGMRIAQAELYKTVPTVIERTLDRPSQKTSRTGGFGSTGT